jgi:two-component system, cell cycle sensor histidine kinase and response regulator CckA
MITCLLLSAYAVFSVVFYFSRIRPRLDPGQPAAAGPAHPLADAGLERTSPHSLSAQAVNPVLQRALDEWSCTFDAIIDPVLILDSELQIVKGNRAAFQLLSVNGAAIEKKQCHQLFAGSDVPCSLCPVQTVRLANEPHCREITHRYLGRIFSVSCSPLFDDGRIAGFVYCAKDISHQRNLEKRLVHAHKLESIATLAGGIAHDFNNILGAVLGNADLLLYRLPPTGRREEVPPGPPLGIEEITEHIQAIRRAGIRAKDLVTQILAFSRQSVNQRHDVLIGPVVKECCRLLRASLPTTIDIKAAVPDGIGMIYADAGQIQQVVMHLCTNAAQSLADNAGVIEISLREVETGKAEQKRYHELAPGKYIVLTVRDTGRGITPETLERIFDPFFTTREVGQGSGMGLAVLHGIIVAHNGIIDVASEIEKGTVFTVFFPRVPDAGGEEDDQQKEMPHGSETILFVDDEEDIVGMRTRMLAHLGYRVLPATSPEQALEYFVRGEERIDLLITDQTMPRITGLELAAKVSALNPQLPIILCSGYSEAVTLPEAQRSGVSRFLAKPVDMRQLALAIREILPNCEDGEEDESPGY